LKEVDKLGNAILGITADKIDYALENVPQVKNNLTNTVINTMKEAGIIERGTLNRTKEWYEGGKSRLASSSMRLIDGTEYLAKESGNAGQEIKNILKFTSEGVSKLFNSVKGETLAWGALGLAGAFLVAGFAGGNPARPAENQAAEDSKGQSYNVPSLQDNSMQPQRKQTGYVINVSGNSDRDNNQHVANSFQQVMQSSFSSTNVNISMNIKDARGNINDRLMDQLLARAINQ
jgi:hypothetical protein